MILDSECDCTVGSHVLVFSVKMSVNTLKYILCIYIHYTYLILFYTYIFDTLLYQIQQSNIPMRRKCFIPSRMWCFTLFFFKCLERWLKKKKKSACLVLRLFNFELT